VTRIFDALRKAQQSHGAGWLHRPSAVGTAPATAVQPHRPASPAPSVAGDVYRRSIVPFRVAVGLPADVAREMASLRVSLESALTERTPRAVMFLAAQGGEGTTTVAAQFVQSLAGDPRLRVLIVDVHARRPAYRSDGTAVLSPRGEVSSPAAGHADLLPLSEASRQDHLVLPETLSGILAAVGSGYDWIVLDGPSVLETPDAAPLGAVVDGILVVAQAGRTKRPVLARSVDLLRRSGGRVLGIVLNRRRLEIPEFIYRRI